MTTQFDGVEAEHMRAWFEDNVECPAGCGHRCHRRRPHSRPAGPGGDGWQPEEAQGGLRYTRLSAGGGRKSAHRRGSFELLLRHAMESYILCAMVPRSGRTDFDS